MTDIIYRAPRQSELADCALIWHAATDDYMRRLGRPLPPPVLDPLVSLLEHLLSTDSRRFMVAARPGGPRRRDTLVGFGIAIQREHVWYLSQLYVLPELQGQGIGHSLLRRILPSTDDGSRDASAPGVLATVTDSAQPTSNGLYSALGIVPRVPLLNLVGRPAPSAPTLPRGVRATAFADAAASPLGSNGSLAAALDVIDTAVLSHARSADHRYFREAGRSGFLYSGDDGELLGYGYSSAAGRFGPVAVLDPTLTAPILAHLIAAIEPRGALSAWVPGSNDRAVVALLRAGLRFEGFPALICWTRPFADFERYLPAGPALL